MPRRNYPLAIKRATFHNRRKNFTNCAVSIKSTTDSYRCQTLYLHYTHEGGIFVSIMIRKVEYIYPLGVIIKALIDISDKSLIEMISDRDSTFNGIQVVKDIHSRGLYSQK